MNGDGRHGARMEERKEMRISRQWRWHDVVEASHDSSMSRAQLLE